MTRPNVCLNFLKRVCKREREPKTDETRATSATRKRADTPSCLEQAPHLLDDRDLGLDDDLGLLSGRDDGVGTGEGDPGGRGDRRGGREEGAGDRPRD